LAASFWARDWADQRLKVESIDTQKREGNYAEPRKCQRRPGQLAGPARGPAQAGAV